MRRDIAGQRFGRLVATDHLKRCGLVTKRLFICDYCGKLRWIETARATTGHTKSCGCWRVQCRQLASGEAVFNQLLDEYQRGAAKRNLVWKLSRSQFRVLVLGNCTYCGSRPNTCRKA